MFRSETSGDCSDVTGNYLCHDGGIERWLTLILRVWTGDLVRAYATYYDRNGWLLRRVWCAECGDTTIREETEGASEVIIEAVSWDNRLVSVEVVAASLQ